MPILKDGRHTRLAPGTLIFTVRCPLTNEGFSVEVVGQVNLERHQRACRSNHSHELEVVDTEVVSATETGPAHPKIGIRSNPFLKTVDAETPGAKLARISSTGQRVWMLPADIEADSRVEVVE